MSNDSRNSAPNPNAEIERLQDRRDELLHLQEMMEKKLKAAPNDFGVRALWGFLIIGFLVGWMRERDVWSIFLYGAVFWVAGLFFCIFALDSAEVQSKIAIFLNKLGEKHISKWLYQRALTIR